MPRKIKYTKQQIIDLILRNARFDIQAGDNCELNEITVQVFSDEGEDYDMFCDILGISKEGRKDARSVF